MDTVFLDANVLFSAAYREDAGLRRLWRLKNVTLVTSTYAIEEARRNLISPTQRQALEELLSAVQVVAVTAEWASLPASVALPDKDRPILAAALSAGATHLLTGDVRDFGRYFGHPIEGVLILPPADYLRGVAAG